MALETPGTILYVVTVSAFLVIGTPAALGGSFDDPELTDPAGDIRYFPGTPPDGHPYIDIVAGFASHHKPSDRVNLTLAMADTSALQEDLGDWFASCKFSFNMIRGASNATLELVWEKDGSSSIEYAAFIYKDGAFKRVDEEYETNMTFGTPGMATWSFAGGYVRSWGDQAQNFTANCRAQMRALAAPTIVTHSDDADGQKSYQIPEAPEAEGDPFDPAADLPPDARNRTGGDEDEESESPGIAVGIVIPASLLAAVLLRRTKHSRR